MQEISTIKEKRQVKEDQTEQQSRTYSHTMIINFREILEKKVNSSLKQYES